MLHAEITPEKLFREIKIQIRQLLETDVGDLPLICGIAS
jgi:hypothetical protein